VSLATVVVCRCDTDDAPDKSRFEIRVRTKEGRSSSVFHFPLLRHLFRSAFLYLKSKCSPAGTPQQLYLSITTKNVLKDKERSRIIRNATLPVLRPVTRRPNRLTFTNKRMSVETKSDDVAMRCFIGSGVQ
jgi:hypothetical protein